MTAENEMTGALPPAKNAFGRRRDEALSTEERLARLNRQLPWSDEAEKGLLSCVLQDPGERLGELRGEIPVEAFYHEANRTMYELLLEMSDKGMAIDPRLVVNALRDKGQYERVGGTAAVSELFTFVPIPSHYPHYKGIVREKWTARQLIHACAEGIDDAYNLGREAVDEKAEMVVAKAEARVFSVLESAQKKGAAEVLDSGQMGAVWVEEFEKICNNRGKLRGFSTGWTDVDRAFHGLAPDEDGDLLVIAGKPGMGKSVAGISVLEAMAIEQAVPTAVFPLEMGRIGWMHRLVLGRAGVNTAVARNGHMKREDPDKIQRALRDVQKAPIYWDNNCSLTTAEMRSRVQLLVRKKKIKCAIFDHLGQLKASAKAAQSDERLGIKEVMETLHFFRRELGLLVVLLVQLSKDADKKPMGQAPQLSDLRGASEIEEYATHVGMLHRPVMYRPWHRFDAERQGQWESVTKPFRTSEPGNWTDWTTNPEWARKDYEEHAILAIRKNRHGATPDNICLRFRAEFQRFTNRTSKLYTNNPDYKQVELPGW